MTTTLALLPLLARLALPLDPAPALPAHTGESGEAWVVVHAGSTWVCWTAESDADACFRRIELEPVPSRPHQAFVPDEELELAPPLTRLDAAPSDPTLGIDLRYGFESGRLWIAIDDVGVWVVEPGQRQARWLDTPTSAVTLTRPSSPSCGPRGVVPGLVAGRIEWIAAPHCPSQAARTSGCVRPRPRLRKPSGVSLELGVSVARTQAWSLAPGLPELGQPNHLQRAAGVEFSFVLAIGFDAPTALRFARTRDELLARDRRRTIPVVDEHPLAEAERAALRTIACTEVP